MAEVRRSWDAILPERVIHLPDPERLAEVIVATIEAASGCAAHPAAGGISGLLPEPLRFLARGAGR
jgi:hypothetical protein